jgi:hypothetical protein
MKENEGLEGLRRHALSCNFLENIRGSAQIAPELF